jgi:hypothetical protein
MGFQEEIEFIESLEENENDGDDDDNTPYTEDPDAAQEEEAQIAVSDDVDKLHLELVEAVFARNIQRKEKMFDAFFGLTGGNPWVPSNFYSDSTTCKEELRIFRSMSPRFERRSALSKKAVGYNFFKDEWNLLTGNRRNKCIVDDTAMPIFFKEHTTTSGVLRQAETARTICSRSQPASQAPTCWIEVRFSTSTSQHCPTLDCSCSAGIFPGGAPRGHTYGRSFCVEPGEAPAMATVRRKRRQSSAPYDVPTHKKPRATKTKNNKKFPDGVTFYKLCSSCGR